MAKIYGMELKSVKTFVGREGYGFNANLYLNGKKIGTCLDSGNGGELDISLEHKLSDETRKEIYTIAERYFNDFPKQLFGTTAYGKLTELVEEIYSLKENETLFKKEVKKGAKGIIEVRYSKRNAPLDLSNYKEDELYIINDLSTVDNLLKEVGAVEYTLYTDIDQFDIKEKSK